MVHRLDRPAALGEPHLSSDELPHWQLALGHEREYGGQIARVAAVRAEDLDLAVGYPLRSRALVHIRQRATRAVGPCAPRAACTVCWHYWHQSSVRSAAGRQLALSAEGVVGRAGERLRKCAA